MDIIIFLVKLGLGLFGIVFLFLSILLIVSSWGFIIFVIKKTIQETKRQEKESVDKMGKK